MGLYAGADDKVGLRILMKQGSVLNFISAGLATLVIELRPQWFYAINGVDNIPENGLLCVRLFALFFILKGVDFLLRMYLNNRKDSKYATMLTVLGNATLPLFAFILWKIAPAPYIFLAYLATEIVVFVMSYVRYRGWLEKDRKEIEENGEDIVLYMSVKPDEAVEASREIRNFAEEHGIDKRIAYRAALCMEEMVAYAQAAEAAEPIMGFTNYKENEKSLTALMTLAGSAPWIEDIMDEIGNTLSIDIMLRFKGKNEAVFVMLDDGKCIMLDKNSETQKLTTNNYELIRKLAKSVEYQYILNMNYTQITFC